MPLTTRVLPLGASRSTVPLGRELPPSSGQLWPNGILLIPQYHPQPVEALAEVPDKAMGSAKSPRSQRGLAAAKHLEPSFEMLMVPLDTLLLGFSGEVLDLRQYLGQSRPAACFRPLNGTFRHVHHDDLPRRFHSTDPAVPGQRERAAFDKRILPRAGGCGARCSRPPATPPPHGSARGIRAKTARPGATVAPKQDPGDGPFSSGPLRIWPVRPASPRKCLVSRPANDESQGRAARVLARFGNSPRKPTTALNTFVGGLLSVKPVFSPFDQIKTRVWLVLRADEMRVIRNKRTRIPIIAPKTLQWEPAVQYGRRRF